MLAARPLAARRARLPRRLPPTLRSVTGKAATAGPAPAHAALVSSMLGALDHLGALARALRDLDVTLGGELQQALRDEAQLVAAEIREQFDLMSWEIMACCDVLTGRQNERNLVGCALDLARLQSAQRSAEDSDGEQALDRYATSTARESFERTAQGAA